MKAKVPIQNDSIFMKILVLPKNVLSKQQNNGDQKQINKQVGSNIKVSNNFNNKNANNNVQNVNNNNQIKNDSAILNTNDVQKQIPKNQDKKQIPQNLLEFTAQSQNNNINNNTKLQFKQQKGDLLEDGQQTYLSEKEKEKVKSNSEEVSKQLRQKWNNEESQNQKKHQIGLEIEPQILKWAKKGNQRNDIRTLLCTMHEILWENSGYKKCNLSSLIDEKSVKMNYLKAIRVVHPDKLQNHDIKDKYIAERVFFELKESWTQFQIK